MGFGPTTTQQTSQQAQSSPWAPAQPELQGLLGSIGGLNTSVTPQQQQALQSLLGSTSNLQNFAPQAGNAANTLLSGGGASAYQPILSNAYSSLQGSLSPLTNPNNLNPMNTPGFGAALSGLNNSITNQVNDQFAASGRDLSPGNTQALATGLSQGEGQLIANQYNANAGNLLNASNSLFGAGAGTASGLSSLNQTGLGNMLAGAGLAGAIPGLAAAPGQAQLSAANAAYGLPLSNLGGMESLLTPIAALGGQSSGTGTSTTQTQTPLWQQLLGGSLVGASLFGSGGFGGPGSLASGILSPSNWNTSLPSGTFGGVG